MGQACSNPLQYLIQNYGGDVAKMVASQKSKQFIDEKLPEIKNKLSSETEKMKAQTMKEIEQQQKSTQKKFESTISEIKSSKPDAIDNYQKLSNSRIDDVFGVNKFKKQFQDLKGTSDKKMNDIQKKMTDQVDVLANKQKQTIDDHTPKLPLFESLPQCLKDKVMTEGTAKFSSQIEQKKKQQQDFFKNKLNFDALKKDFGGQLPTDKLKSLSKNIDESFTKSKSLISGGGGQCQII